MCSKAARCRWRARSRRRSSRSPSRFARALAIALRMSRRSPRSWPYHLIYLAEAAWLCQATARRRHRPSARPLRNQRAPRSRCSCASSAGRPTASPCTDRKSSTRPKSLHLRAKIEKRRVRRRDQLLRPQPALSLDRRRPVVEGPRRALRPRCGNSIRRPRARPSPRRASSASAACASKRGSFSCSTPSRSSSTEAGHSRSSLPATASCGRRSNGRSTRSACASTSASRGGSTARGFAPKCSRRGRWCCRASPKDCRS